MDGFTLLEVLVAVSLLAVSFGVLMRIFGAASNTANIARDYRQALLVAESRLALATTDWQTTGSAESGIVGDRFRWAVGVSPYELNDPKGLRLAQRPELVTVVVSWGKHNDEREVTLSTVRLNSGGRRQ